MKEKQEFTQSKLSKYLIGDLSKMFFAISGNRGVSVSTPITQIIDLRGGSSARSEVDPLVLIKEGYELNAFVYACIDRRVKNVDLVDWFVERKKGDEWILDTKHPLNKLLAKPDPNRKMNTDQFIKGLVLCDDIAGNFIIRKIRDGKNNKGQLHGLEILPVFAIKPVSDDRGYITHYKYTISPGNVETIPAEDIIHGMQYNPADPTWGLSKIKVLGETIDTDNAAQSWNKHALSNRGVPDGIFIVKQSMEDDEYEEAMERVREKYTGINNAREPKIINGDVEYVPTDKTPVEMDYINGRKHIRSIIAAVFGVPLPLVGDNDASTYNNMKQMVKSLWEDSIIPTLNHIMATLNYDFRLEYEEEVRINYSLANVQALREDYGAKLDDALKMLKLGVPVEEINRILDLGIDITKLKPIDQ